MIQGFWEEVLKVWDTGIFGTNMGEVFLAAGIVLLFLLVRKIFFHTFMKIFQRLARKTQTELDNQILEALEKPLEFAFVVVGLYIAGQFVTLSETLS